jgi:hypothetical protein
MSEDDYWIRLAGVKQKRALIMKGVRYDPVQKMPTGFETPDIETEGQRRGRLLRRRKNRRRKF